MEKEIENVKKSAGLLKFMVVVLFITVFFQGMSTFFDKKYQETVARKCAEEWKDLGVVDENVSTEGGYLFLRDGGKMTLEKLSNRTESLEAQLSKTNKELNRVYRLVACLANK